MDQEKATRDSLDRQRKVAEAKDPELRRLKDALNEAIRKADHASELNNGVAPADLLDAQEKALGALNSHIYRRRPDAD